MRDANESYRPLRKYSIEHDVPTIVPDGVEFWVQLEQVFGFIKGVTSPITRLFLWGTLR